MFLGWLRNHRCGGALESWVVAGLLVFVLANNLLWSLADPFTGSPYGAPDEIHHFEVPSYIFAHHQYPVFGPGRDLYIRVPPGQPDDINHRIYGWYATNPWGAYLYGAATMFALGNTPWAGSIYAARLSSVLMGVLVVYLAYLTARQLFPARLDLRLAVPALIALIPQVTYVSSYFNADMFSMLCTALVVYAWVLGVQNGFARRTCLFLGLSLGLSALARVNCWIIVYPFSLVLLLVSWRGHWRSLLGRLGLAFLIPAAVFALWFAYNTATYGDLLAKQVSDLAWAQDRPFLVSYANRGYTLWSFLTNTSWLEEGFKSFWCVLGYMAFPLRARYYIAILGFCGAAVAGLGLGIARRRAGWSRLWRSWQARMLAVFALVCLVAAGASLYTSFYQDFQPQGRYLFPALVPISVLLVLGLGEIPTRAWGRRLIWLAAGFGMVLLQGVSFYLYLILRIAQHA